MIEALYILRSRAARIVGKSIIDANWRPEDGPMPFIRNYGPFIVALDLAIILAIALRGLLLP